MSQFYIGWWNLENLFDVQNSPRREKRIESKIKSDVKGWTSQLLDKKISQLSKIIRLMNTGAGPDILGVCEIENKHVLEKLVQSLSPLNRNYNIAHSDTSDGRGIDVAFLYDKSKFKFEDSFQHWVVKRYATRELFQINLLVKENNTELVLVGNHWPSRTSGTYLSEPYRMLAGETLSYWLSRILEEKGNDVPVLVMGDFNDEPFNRSIMEYALATNSKSKVRNAKTAPRLYNIMWELLSDGVGTYNYKGNWNMLDQFMISKGLITTKNKLVLEKGSTKVEKFSEMTKKGKPIRFGLPKNGVNQQGFSDHFPISTIIKTVD